jgi:hypothetical protein
MAQIISELVGYVGHYYQLIEHYLPNLQPIDPIGAIDASSLPHMYTHLILSVVFYCISFLGAGDATWH